MFGMTLRDRPGENAHRPLQCLPSSWCFGTQTGLS